MNMRIEEGDIYMPSPLDLAKCRNPNPVSRETLVVTSWYSSLQNHRRERQISNYPTKFLLAPPPITSKKQNRNKIIAIIISFF